MQNTTIAQDTYRTPMSNVEAVTSVGNDDELTMFPEACFPSNAVINELMDTFFDHVYLVLPCFHKKTFMEKLQSGNIQAQSPLLLYSMLAVAAGFHNDAFVKARRTEWYEQAKFLYDFTGRDPYPALRTLQAALCLVYHAYTCGDFSACWLYIGKAWRQAAALGMNRMDSENAVVMPMGLKDGFDSENRGYYNRVEWTGRTVRL